jgi:glycosyltransferase involved in cell wall biosynthesis
MPWLKWPTRQVNWMLRIDHAKTSMTKLHVLHVVPSYFPALYFGGPVVSVYELCNSLVREDHHLELRVLTTDTAGPAKKDRLNIRSLDRTLYNGYTVAFCAKAFGTAIAPSLWCRIWREVRWADIIHLTAVYSFTTIPTLIAARAFRKPLVWSPRGAFQRWVGTRRRSLKLLWGYVCRLLSSSHRTVLHVTSEEEATETWLAMPAPRRAIIQNGVNVPSFVADRPWRPGGNVRLVFLGRLDPKKGIENLLRAMSLLRDSSCSLAIYGDGSNEYLSKLQSLCQDLGVAHQVTFQGPVSAEGKGKVFNAADVCVVPSFTENFGMVIAEALAHGVPVIASTGTPWRELESRGAGLWVSNDAESLAHALESIKKGSLSEMGRKGREWMLEQYSWSTIARRMADLYREMISTPYGTGRADR